MSKKKKIALGVLCVLLVFLVYEIGDWSINRHWIGTTKETEIVQEHWIPIEKDLSGLGWEFECGDELDDYINVATDLGLFGTYKTLRSGACWKTTHATVDNPQEYVKTKVIPWLEKQGFPDIYTHEYGDGNDDWSELSLGEMWVSADDVQPLTDMKGYLLLKVSVHTEPDSDSHSADVPRVHITITQSYFSIRPVT